LYERRGDTLQRLRRAVPSSFLVLAALVGCAARVSRAPLPEADPARGDEGGTGVPWQYEIHYGVPRDGDLEVEAAFAKTSSDVFRIDEDSVPFVGSLLYAAAGGWQSAPRNERGWEVPCRQAGCRVRYRFALREAADQLDAVDTAIASGDVVVAPPPTWLVRPSFQTGRFRFRVRVRPPSRFATGIRRSPDGAADTYEAPIDAFEGASFAVFGPFLSRMLERGSARVDIAIAPYALALTDDDVVAWTGTAVDAISKYFGRFAVPHTLVIVHAGQQRVPTRGETLGDGGPAVLLGAAGGMVRGAIRDDWVMTHELLHVTLPSLSREHAWLGEGIASYVEPVARARIGQITSEKFWHDLVDGMPQGLPMPGDQGLERTHTWGRTYWGGALFCLLADVAIREQTANARSLDDALRAIVATGADVENVWDIEHFLDVADDATGTRVLHDLYRELASSPGQTDLPALWNRLGVRVKGGRIEFDDAAPLAFARRAVTLPAQAKGSL